MHRGALFARLGKDAVNLHGDKHKKVDDAEAEPTEDPLIEFRSMLTVGISANQWIKGSSKTQLMFVASQWDALLVKPPSKKVKKGERIMIRDIDKIVKGHGEGESAKEFGLIMVGLKNTRRVILQASSLSANPTYLDHMKKNTFGKPTAKANANTCLRILSRPKAGDEARDLLCLSFQNGDNCGELVDKKDCSATGHSTTFHLAL